MWKYLWGWVCEAALLYSVQSFIRTRSLTDTYRRHYSLCAKELT